MKKDLRDVIELQKPAEAKEGLSKLIDNNKGIVKALGIASFIALAGYSAAQLLKDKKLMKKIKEGFKTPKAIQHMEKLLGEDVVKSTKAPKVTKALAPAKEEKSKPAKKKTSVKSAAKAARVPEKIQEISKKKDAIKAKPKASRKK